MVIQPRSWLAPAIKVIPKKEADAVHVSRSGKTEFEKAVVDYLTAVAIGSPSAPVPPEIAARYKGSALRKWQKTILRTRLYKRIKAATGNARTTKQKLAHSNP